MNYLQAERIGIYRQSAKFLRLNYTHLSARHNGRSMSTLRNPGNTLSIKPVVVTSLYCQVYHFQRGAERVPLTNSTKLYRHPHDILMTGAKTTYNLKPGGDHPSSIHLHENVDDILD